MRLGLLQLGLVTISWLLMLNDVQAQSLFTARTIDDGSMYADSVARKVGDLITIRIAENMTVAERMETGTTRENDASINLLQVPFTTRGASTGGGVGALPGLNVASAKEFAGEGEVRGSGSMSFTLAGRVIDVLANGNLVIEARRTLSINKDSKTVLLTGICARSDIESDNTVPSVKIHNFEVSVVGEGPLTQAQQQGLLGRILDVIWPF